MYSEDFRECLWDTKKKKKEIQTLCANSDPLDAIVPIGQSVLRVRRRRRGPGPPSPKLLGLFLRRARLSLEPEPSSRSSISSRISAPSKIVGKYEFYYNDKNGRARYILRDGGPGY